MSNILPQITCFSQKLLSRAYSCIRFFRLYHSEIMLKNFWLILQLHLSVFFTCSWLILSDKNL